MAFYPQFPAFYAYPMPYPSQEFYAMYPPGSTGVDGNGGSPPGGNGPIYFDGGMMPHSSGGHKSSFGSSTGGSAHGKVGYNNRKVSSDSGISDFSDFSSRKSSNTSTVSNMSIMHEESGLDDVKEEEPYEEPDDDLCEKIVAQVEFYFGDANITKDKFLLKHVKKNKEGFVSLKLISSFKRVKHLTKDWRQVAEAIERKSSKLEVNDLKTKVRRLEALPEYDETTPSRTVVALNLPLERPTIEAVAEIFSVCGDIVLVRILRPGNPIPADIKPFANKHPEMTAKVCALVEFERTEFALKAVKELNGSGDGDNNEAKMIVMELTAPPPKTTKNKDDKRKTTPLSMQRQPYGAIGGQVQGGPTRRFSHAGFGQQAVQIQQQHGSTYHHQQPQQQQHHQNDIGPRRRISLYHNMKFTPIAEEQQVARKNSKDNMSGGAGGLNPNAPTFTMQQQQQMHHNKRMSRPSTGAFMHDGMMMGPHAAAAHAAVAHAAAAAAAAAYQHGPIPMMRRISAASGLSLPPNVIRLPRGPEKNAKGFQRWCRSRMQETNEPLAPASAPATPAVTQPLRKPGSHAVPIVAPPTVDKKAAAETAKPAVAAKPADNNEVVKKDEEAAVDDAEVVKEAIEVKEEPSAPAQEAAPVDVPVVAHAAENRNHESGDSGNEDEGHFSEPEAAGHQEPAAVEPQGPGFAAAFASNDNDEDKSR